MRLLASFLAGTGFAFALLVCLLLARFGPPRPEGTPSEQSLVPIIPVAPEGQLQPIAADGFSASGGTASGGTASGGTASGGTASGGTASGETPPLPPYPPFMRDYPPTSPSDPHPPQLIPGPDGTMVPNMEPFDRMAERFDSIVAAHKRQPHRLPCGHPCARIIPGGGPGHGPTPGRVFGLQTDRHTCIEYHSFYPTQGVFMPLP